MIIGRPLMTIGWGVYCACSWTWCIGMFLPVVMLHRFGWPGFLAFLIPNVAGCAAFGFIVKSRDRSREMVVRHRAAMRWFSFAAIAFHGFFIAFAAIYLLPDGQEHWWFAPAAVIGLLAAAWIVSRLSRPLWPGLAVIVYAGSLSVMFSAGLDGLREINWSGVLSTADLLWLTPTLCFGFLLCPLMDLTFHRAMQATGSRNTFIVFALTFAAMPLVTCLYAEAPVDMLMTIFVVHISVQSVFTVAAHVREAIEFGGEERRSHNAVICVGILVLLAGAAPIALSAAGGSYATAERAYLCWFVFYGLVFPAFVLLFMMPGGVMRADGRSLRWFAVAMIAAIPFYWIGFIEEHMWALAPPLAGLAAWKAARIARAKARE